MSVSLETMHQLQNGSDVRGVASPTLGQTVTLRPEAANRIAQAFVRQLAAQLHRRASSLQIGVGYDPRLTSEALSAQALRGIAAQKAQGVGCGLCSTPAMFMATQFPETRFDGAIMITASHLPIDRNGMKFFTRDGGLDASDIASILSDAAALPMGGPCPRERLCALLPLYAAYLRETIRAGLDAADTPLAGLKIAVDAGNGSGGFFARDVLEPLGADISGSRFLNPDGTFPHHIPNPENRDVMRMVCAATLESGSDLGLVFDTDVDRMAAVLPDGSQIHRDAMIAMIASILAPDHPGATIVTDSVTSDRLTDFLENTLGFKHRRFKRGYRAVINEAVRLEQAGTSVPLAMETSGHGALAENHFLDDGAYLAVLLVIAAAKDKRDGRALGARIAGLAPAFEERELRVPIAGDDVGEYAEQVLAAFERRAADAGLTVVPDSCEGVRLTFPDAGWLLLRISLHDPLLPLNVEGRRAGDCARLLQIARDLLTGFDRLDLSGFDRP